MQFDTRLSLKTFVATNINEVIQNSGIIAKYQLMMYVSAKIYLYVVNVRQYNLVTVERFQLDLKTVTLVHEKTISDDRFTL